MHVLVPSTGVFQCRSVSWGQTSLPSGLLVMWWQVFNYWLLGRGRPWFIPFTNFCSLNIANLADFQLPVSCHWRPERHSCMPLFGISTILLELTWNFIDNSKIQVVASFEWVSKGSSVSHHPLFILTLEYSFIRESICSSPNPLPPSSPEVSPYLPLCFPTWHSLQDSQPEGLLKNTHPLMSLSSWKLYGCPCFS